MFELTDVYYIDIDNTSFALFPSYNFSMFFETMINKTKGCICLTKLLPTMMSI